MSQMRRPVVSAAALRERYASPILGDKLTVMLHTKCECVQTRPVDPPLPASIVVRLTDVPGQTGGASARASCREFLLVCSECRRGGVLVYHYFEV
jgi:hypothetical protein